MEFKTLKNGIKMPSIGLGTWKNCDDTIQIVKDAIELGYRHIDTATFYFNEAGVGAGINQCSIARDEIFLTTKVWNDAQGYDNTLKAFETSLKKLNLNYVDLYLVHWPKDNSSETWKALEKLYREGLVKAIGVANFQVHHLHELLKTAKVMPMVNQVEFHPRLVQKELLAFCNKEGIIVTGWAPLMQGHGFEIPLLQEIALKYKRCTSQIILRWAHQMGVIPIPKTVHHSRLIENLGIFDFQIEAEDMVRIATLNDNHRFGPDPDNFNF